MHLNLRKQTMKNSWSEVARTQSEKAHKEEVASLKATIGQFAKTVAELESQLGIALSLGADASEFVPEPFNIPTSDKAEAVAFAMASDWHAEETVLKASTNGLNEYNLDIANDRIEKFFTKLVRLTEIERNGAKIEDLVLWLGGDMMTGMIHEELAETNSLTPTEVILWLQRRILAGIETLRPHFRNIYIPTSYGNHGRCHDEHTELLTADGWKFWDEIRIGDVAATLNMETGGLEWQPLSDVYVNRNYDGDMYQGNHMSADFMVTPNHRMVLSSRHNKELKVVEAQEFSPGMSGHWALPKVVENFQQDYDEVTDDELRLVGWLLTDGSVVKSSFTKHNERLSFLMDRHKQLPSWCFNLSQRQVLVLLQAIKDGDGACGKNPDGHFEVHGTSEFLSELQALLVCNGKSAIMRKTQRGDCVLSVRVSKVTTFQHRTFRESYKTMPYKGVVWCGTVPNGTLITRRNGHVLVSGNSTQKMRHGTGAKHSYEWLMYKILEGQTGDDQVKWQVSESYFNFMEVFGRKIRFHHGDGLRYQGGIGGLTIPTEKAIASWNKSPNRADLDLFGHWHQYQQSRTWLCNGSLIGYNAYALSIKASFEPPTQTFFLLDKKRGRTMTAPILL